MPTSAFVDTTQSVTSIAQQILAEASAAAKKLRDRNVRATYADYERYKSELYAYGCYGYEAKLADIFNL